MTLVDPTAPPLIAEEPSTVPRSVSSIAIAIGVREVGKMYRIYDRPQDRLKQMIWRGYRMFGHEFWALRKISFEVKKGESVGIIGRNGSGKSTLLQIIAGTLAPTEGEASINGRVNALLELGSGFNPEFTGRENVFLNGAILGMAYEEMEERFDEIAAFADIGEFIEQPVKLYSSGMAVRLAFAVQAVVPKEILIIDEALAVGDEAFQRKCMRALEEFREQGGTVLLVSHNAQAIVRQCSRCLFMHQGQLVIDGPSKPVTDLYQRFIYGTAQQQQATLALMQEHRASPIEQLLDAVASNEGRQHGPRSKPILSSHTGLDATLPQPTEIVYGTGEAEILDCVMYDQYERPVNVLLTGQKYFWAFRVRFYEAAWNINFGMMIRTVDGVEVVGINSRWEGHQYERIERGGLIEIRFHFTMNIGPGTYYLESGVIGDTAASAGEANFLHRRVDVCSIRVIAPDDRRIVGLAYLDPDVDMRRLEN